MKHRSTQHKKMQTTKRRNLIIILIVLVIVAIIVATVAVLYFTTDVFDGINKNRSLDSSSRRFRDNKQCGDINCGANGYCNTNSGQKVCQCNPGYTGEKCEQMKTSCSENPCENGFCRCSERGFYCVCKANYTGKYCQNIKTPPCNENSNERCQRLTTPPQAEVGWYAPGNGYQYLLSESTRTWNDSQKICRRFGASLASEGPRHYETRILLVLDLVKDKPAWIGLSDTSGTWAWTDLVPGDESNTFWLSNASSDELNENRCALLGGFDDYELNSRRFLCISHYRALCEKRISTY